MEALMGSGLKANVTDKLNDILLRAVTTNARFADLQEELRAHLLGKDGGQGAFARYATTYATTALSQFTGQNNKLFTDDLGTDWFEYVGSNIETSRPFCLACTKKRYIHRSEIHDLLAGHIHIVGGDDIDVEIYDKTGLPKGMIDGTTEENFQVNVGGWNCRHQLVPIAAEAVPENIRQEIEGIKRAEKMAKELRKSKEYTDVETNAKGGLKATHKGHIIHSADKEQTFFADRLTSTELELKCQDQLFQMGHTAILRDESQTDERGEFIPSLDMELDGTMMDIASITQGTFGSALKNKNRQLARVAQKTGYVGDEVCLYVHDKAIFLEEKLLHDIEYFKTQHQKWGSSIYIKHIRVVVNGDSRIHLYEV